MLGPLNDYFDTIAVDKPHRCKIQHVSHLKLIVMMCIIVCTQMIRIASLEASYDYKSINTPK